MRVPIVILLHPNDEMRVPIVPSQFTMYCVQGKKLVSIVPRPSEPHKADLSQDQSHSQSPFVFKSAPSGMKSDKKCRKVSNCLATVTEGCQHRAPHGNN